MSDLNIGLMRTLVQLNDHASTGAQELWLCSAYLTRAGLSAIAPVLDSADQHYGVFGAGPLTDPQAVRYLMSRNAEVRLFPHSPQSEFHPKCYMGIQKDGRAWAAVGSANLTGRGAEGNVELLASATGPADHPFFVDLKEYLSEMHSCAVPSSDPLLQELDMLHSSHVQVMQAIQEANQQLATAQESMRSALGRVDDFWSRRLSRDALLNYIQTTKLFASYKLVILGLLLNTPDGRLSLSELATRFHAFYRSLYEAGALPERPTGSPPPQMLKPRALSQAQVEAILVDAPRLAFKNTGGVVVYGTNSFGKYLAIARVLWVGLTAEAKRGATEAVLERLERYYQQHTGSYSEIRTALSSAIER